MHEVDLEILKTITQLDYCNALYLELPMESAVEPQQVQNTQGRLLTGAGCWDHVTPLQQIS